MVCVGSTSLRAVESIASPDMMVKEVDLEGLTQREKDYVKKRENEKNLQNADPDYNRPGDGGGTWKKWVNDSSDTKAVADMSLRDLEADYEQGVTKKQFETVILVEWRAHRLALGKSIDRSDAKTGPSGMTEVQRKTAAFKNATGLDKSDHGDEYTAFEVEYDRRVQEEGAVKSSDKTKILDQMIKEKIVFDKSDTWFSADESKNLNALTKEEMKTFAVDAEIPKKDQDLFIANIQVMASKLRGAKKKVSRANILALWKTKKAKNP